MARHCALALSIPMTGPNFFRPDIKRYAVNKSPFVHSASKEVYQRVTYKVQMDVWDAHDKAVEVMLKVILASGRGQHVRVKVEKYSLGS
jgi:ribosomal protein S10